MNQHFINELKIRLENILCYAENNEECSLLSELEEIQLEIESKRYFKNSQDGMYK